MERLFESILWKSRLIVLVAVVASMLVSLAMFFMATVDALSMVSHLGDYLSASPGEERIHLRSLNVTHIVEIVDGYLLAVVLLIFSLGLYELFVSKIDEAENSETASNVLMIHSLDDLKARLAKVVIMILIVKFFEHTASMKFGSMLDLLMLAGGIALLGVALFLTHASEGKGGH
ncbi:MAG: YqhA family protein [Gammaproteobacteria bacterium]|nr:MAG: YqhA family protein [Gammaproteobacteria bacterium]